MAEKEYIERGALLENLKKQYGEELGWQYTVNMSDVGMMIEDAEAADVVEVRHGKWLKTDAYPHRVYCSLCYRTYVMNEEIIAGRSEHPTFCTEAEYCPHCGAKMDGKEQA